MAWICLCRGINEKSLQDAFVKARDAKGGADVAVKDTKELLGNFVCGRCGPEFKKAAKQFNETGEVDILKRPTEISEPGRCAKANSQDDAHATDAPPDLFYSAVEKKEPAPIHR